MDTGKNSAAGAGRVVLVFPRTGLDRAGVSVFLPLAIAFVGSALERAGYRVELVDMRVGPDWERRLAAACASAPLYVGISAMTGTQIGWGQKAAAVVRRTAPDVPVVWGGVHAAILPEQTLAADAVDAVVIGPGEGAAVRIADLLAAGRREEVVGIAHRSEDGAGWEAVSAKERLAHLAAFDWRRYLMPIGRNRRGLAHVTSRGCPHRCGYCYNRAVNGARWEARPADAVVEELADIAALGVAGVLLFDDNFFVSRVRAEAVARGIIDRGLRLSIKADCRADYIVRYDGDFLSLLRKAGFELFYIGAESGSDRVLAAMDKGVTVSELLEANRRLAAHDIRPHYSFMAGLPGETIHDMRSTIDLMLRLKEEHPGAYLSPIKGYVPYPGTALYEAAIAQGFAPPASLDEWSRFTWDEGRRTWLDPEASGFLEKAIYVSSGLDPSVAELAGLDRSGLAATSFQRFGRLCRRRAARADLGAIPELPIVRLIKRTMRSA